MSWFRLDADSRANGNPTGLFSGNRFNLPKANAPLGTVVDYEGFAEILRRIPVDLTYKPRKTKRRTIKKGQPK